MSALVEGSKKITTGEKPYNKAQSLGKEVLFPAASPEQEKQKAQSNYHA